MLAKIIKISIISIAAVIIVVSGTVCGIYYYGVRRNKAVEIIGKVELSPADAKLGQIVTATVLLKCPWHRKVLEAAAQPGKGASLLNAPEISRRSIRWGYNIWKVSVEFKAYRTGIIPAGKLDVSYNRYNDKTTDLSKVFKIPPFKCAPLALDKKQNIILAGVITPAGKISSKGMYIILGVVALVIIAAIILFIIRRGKKTQIIILPSWTIALHDLHALRNNIKSGSITLNTGFISLTDIVRSYLEKRFKLPVSKQTTQEFLQEINQDGGPLPKVQGPFLKEFMQAADLVKFAKLPPDENTLNQALGKAETLVNETRPADIETNNSEGGGTE